MPSVNRIYKFVRLIIFDKFILRKRSHSIEVNKASHNAELARNNAVSCDEEPKSPPKIDATLSTQAVRIHE